MSTSWPRAVSIPVRTAAPLPRLTLWVTTRTVESCNAESTLPVPSVDPSSTTTTSSCIGNSTARMRRRISAMVLRSLNTGTMTDSVR